MDFPVNSHTIFQSNHRSHHHHHHHRNHHHSQSVHSSSPSRQPLLRSVSPAGSVSSTRASPPPSNSLEPIKTSGVILGGNNIIGGNGPANNGLTMNGGNSPGRGGGGGGGGLGESVGGNGNGSNGGNSGLLINGNNILINSHSTRSVRKLHLIKGPDDPPDAGLTLCGGLEVGLHGTIYISRIAEHSIAEKIGLAPGDQILSVNYTSFLDSSISCQKAIHLICTQDVLTLNVLSRSEALTSHRRHATYHWVDPEGRPISPPPPDRDLILSTESEFDPLLVGESGSGSPSARINLSPRRRLSARQSEQLIRTVQIIIEKGINPGLMIRGGLEYGLGIYVTGIESMSAAERGGLKIGDQILSVNNHDFQHVLHDEAVDILRSSPRLTMKVRYVGKIPASNVSLIHSSSSSSSAAAQLTSSDGSSSSTSHTEFPFNHIPSSRCSLPETSHLHRLNRSPCGSQRTSSPGTGSPGYRPISEQGTNRVTPTLLVTESAEEEILEEKLNQLLPEKDRITFAYYRNEYETKGMTVDAFIALFLELLDTREKYSLLNHFRIIIREEDLDKFDELIFKREEQLMIKSKANPIESAHMIGGDDEESSENSISFGQETTIPGNHHHGHQMTSHHGHYHHHSSNDSPHTKSTKLNSIPIEKNSSRNGNVSVRFRPEIDSLSPISFTKDQPVPRRHSSCNPEIKSTSNFNDFLGVPVNLDERRWSIADSHDLPSKYNKESVYEYHDNLRQRSLSGVEMKTINSTGIVGSDNRDNHMKISGTNSNLYHSDDKVHLVDEEDELIAGDDDMINDRHHHHRSSNHDNYSSSIFQSRVRRHSSLPGQCSFNSTGQLPSSSPFHYQPHRSSSFRIPYHRSVREPDGRLRVIVKKSKPILGLAIEGGSDVPSQLQPRIISIHSSGAAFDTGDLHVGHIILEVDGLSTANLSHEQVAQMMAMAYYNTPHKDHIEFVVREKSKSEFDIRRSSFMLLNNSFE